MEIKDLLKMLTYRRPYNGIYEMVLAQEFLEPLGAEQHESGNWLLTVGDNFKTCFTAHLDTVHAADGIQQVQYCPDTQLVFKADGQPLGADDAAGIWLLINMIEAGIPGLYLFCVGEEKGCVGSEAIADDHPMLLAGIDRVISFDRKGTSDVVISQMGGQCCSDEFARALCLALGKNYAPAIGLLTDSASFTHLVPECTNISVGYGQEHTQHEYLNLDYLCALKEIVLKLDWEALPTVRTPVPVQNPWEDFLAEDEKYYSTSLFHEEWGIEYDDLSSLITNHPDRVLVFLANHKFTGYDWDSLCKGNGNGRV